MRYRTIAIACFLIFHVSGSSIQSVAAQPLISGIWKVTFEERDLEAALILNQHNANLQGTWTLDNSASQPVEGTVFGDSLRFISRQKEQNGKVLISTHVGTIAGNTMNGHLSFRWEDGAQIGVPRPWSAERISTSVSSPLKNAKDQIFNVSEMAENQLKDHFQTVLNRIHKREQFPGAIAAFILDDGRSAVVATGVSDQEFDKPMMADDRMLVGSVGKTFVAALAMDLAHQGLLKLDSPISHWLDSEPWFDQLPNAHEITLRMLLNHSSGLINHVQDEHYVAVIQEKVKNSTFQDFVFSPQELVAFALDQPPLFPAGEGYNYTDTGYILVGVIIEKATGLSYYDQLQKRFLDPLLLKQSSPANSRKLPGLVPGYMSPENPMGLPSKTIYDGQMVFNPSTEWTGGGMISNPSDLVQWAKYLYEGKAMTAPYLQDLLNSTWKGRQGNAHYGLGVSIVQSALGPAYGHDGWFPGYRSKVTYYPEYKMAIAVQVNTDVQVDLGRYIDKLAGALLTSTSD